MARLPIPGSDDGTWGDILNNYLLVAHNTDGTLKDIGIVASKYTKPSGGIPETDLDSSVQTKLNAGSGVSDATTISKGIIQLAGDLTGTATAPTIATGAITAAKIANLTITDAQISGSAAIAQSKISNLTSDLSGKQPLDSDLTAIAALTPINDDVIQRKAGAWTNRTPAQLKTDLALTKADVGLANVDNTSDANKPISSATQTALNAKADDSALTAHISDTSAAHAASAISFSPTGSIAASDVQAAIAEVAAEAVPYTGATANVNLNAHLLQNIGNATTGTDALNRQTADSRYVGTGLPAPPANVQVFTADGTWTKPTAPTGCAAYSMVRVLCIGAGAGGGSGRRGAAGTARCGGGGGGAGGWAEAFMPIGSLGATENVTIGLGGAGGAAVTTDDTNGNSGTGGTATVFGASSTTGWVWVSASNPGTGGGNGVAGTGGGSVTVATISGNGGSSSSATGTAGTNSSTIASPSPTGGGGGGGVSTTNTDSVGGTGSSKQVIPSLSTATTAGAAGGGNGGAGTSPQGSATLWWPGRGGGGGGGNAAGAGGTGGAGGKFGGGGGGGGGSLNGFNSGAGGNGADGLVVVTCR